MSTGLSRTLVANMIEGVNNGYNKSLEIVGVGYVQVKADSRGECWLPSRRDGSTGEHHLQGGEQHPGDRLRHRRGAGGQRGRQGPRHHPPEPYKGKGIKYEGERILRKAGKSGKK